MCLFCLKQKKNHDAMTARIVPLFSSIISIYKTNKHPYHGKEESQLDKKATFILLINPI